MNEEEIPDQKCDHRLLHIGLIVRVRVKNQPSKGTRLAWKRITANVQCLQLIESEKRPEVTLIDRLQLMITQIELEVESR